MHLETAYWMVLFLAPGKQKGFTYIYKTLYLLIIYVMFDTWNHVYIYMFLRSILVFGYGFYIWWFHVCKVCESELVVVVPSTTCTS